MMCVYPYCAGSGKLGMCQTQLCLTLFLAVDGKDIHFIDKFAEDHIVISVLIQSLSRVLRGRQMTMVVSSAPKWICIHFQSA